MPLILEDRAFRPGPLPACSTITPRQRLRSWWISARPGRSIFEWLTLLGEVENSLISGAPSSLFRWRRFRAAFSTPRFDPGDPAMPERSWASRNLA